jgi:hypothetical protein
MEHEKSQKNLDSGENLLEAIEHRMPDYEDVRVGKRFPRWLRWLFNLFLLFVVFPVIVFQIPWIQSKSANYLTSYLSKELDTKVSVSRVSLGFFNQILLRDFYLEDLKGDTLVYAGNLKVNHSGLYQLIIKQFKVEALYLDNATVNLSKMEGEEENNLAFVLQYFGLDESKRRDKKSKPVAINLRHLYFNNIIFKLHDNAKGSYYDAMLENVAAHFDRFDLKGKELELSRLEIRRPFFSVRVTKGTDDSGKNFQMPESQMPASDDSTKLTIKVNRFHLNAGRFSLRNYFSEPARTTEADVLNYNYLDVFDIDVTIRDFLFHDLNFYGKIDRIAARDSSGFVLDNLAVKDAAVTCEGIHLKGLELQTPDSWLGDTLIFKYKSYRAFNDFENDVKLEAHFNGAKVVLKDILTFAPALRRNTFFAENQDEIFEIDGLVKGAINRFDGRDLKINIAGGALLEGSFSTRNLAVTDEQYLHLNLRSLRTDVKTLGKLIPSFKPPDNFYKLGKLNFSGKFDGFFVDFVADGKLDTDLGSATLFMNLKVKDGKEMAQYSGDMYLRNFDLGKWTGNKDIGKITLNTHVKEGRGLTTQSAQAKLEANVDSFSYKGYKYGNLTLNGQIQQKLFDGIVSIDDPNLKFNFEGEIDFLEAVPSFNFRAEIDKIALKPLNISKEDFQFNGNMAINFTGTGFSDALGNASLTDFIMVKNQKDTLKLITVDVLSDLLPNGDKHFSLVSNLGSVDLKGIFSVDKVPGKFVNYLTHNFPGFSNRFKIKESNSKQDTARFEYLIELKELQNLIGFFNENIRGFDHTRISGFYDGYRNILTSEVEIPVWSINDVSFEDVYFRTKLEGSEGNLQVGVVSTSIGESQQLSPVSLLGDIYKDTLEFLLVSTNFTEILDNININGVLSLEDDNLWRVSFKQSDLVIFNEKWEINTSNFLRIGNGTVETKDFALNNKDQQILLRSLRNEGLEFQLKNYPLQSLQFFREMKEYRISGVGDVILKVRDVFKFEGLSSTIRIDDLVINGDNYGLMRADILAQSTKKTINAFLSLEHDTMSLAAHGYFNPGTVEDVTEGRWVANKGNYFDFELSFDNYPVRILNYFVKDVSEVKGTASTERVRFYGSPGKPELDGAVRIRDASFILNPLKTAYYIPSATIKVGSNLFDGTGNIVYDRFRNRAYVEGGITHQNLKKFGLNVRISTEQTRGFLGFELSPKDNPVFYGTAIGSGHVRITGDFKQANLYVKARTMPGSKLTIPISNSARTAGSGFLTFKNSLSTGDADQKAVELRGMNMEFDLDITQDAEMQLIFDKAWGDILKGTGDGTMRIVMTREGAFNMYGDYLIASGDYLFTLMNLILNKPFEVVPGGTVSWTGDPYNATINVGAVYKSLNTSVYNFIAEYLSTATSDLQALARSNTPVDLTMKLSGSLLRPDIDFDIDFPSLDSELRNYAENKIRIIRQDANELNRQVFGLLVLGQFLPSGYTLQAGDVGIKTLSEMLSSQLSIYLTEFVSELFTGSNLVQGIDLDISYNRYSGGAFNDPSFFTGNELQGRLKVTISDRMYIHVGGNFDIGGGSTLYPANSALLAGEFMIEYVLTKDRRFKIKAYNSTEPDIAGGRRNKIGAGLSFRKEFDSLSELLNFRKQKS